MKYSKEEIAKAREFYRNNFNSLPIEIRRSLASPHDRLLEIDIAINMAEQHLTNLRQRRTELVKWMMDWYHNEIKEQKQ